MFKKAGVIFCLLVFTFQAVLFNVFLYGFILTIKLDESKYSQGLQSISLNENQYKKLHWLSKDEFSFSNYLIDVKKEKKLDGKIILLCKVDLKEKNFLENLTGHLKNTKNKRTTGFSFIYKISEPYKINFMPEAKIISYKNMLVSVYETQQEKSSPPPKI